MSEQIEGTEQGKSSKPEKIAEQVLDELKASMRSVLLATVDDEGNPHTGYTPFVFDGKQIIIFVSQLSVHTRDLLATGKVSAMLISDEGESDQIFARTRVSYQCHAEVISKESADYDVSLDMLQARQGKMIGLLKQLPDFVLFRLSPQRGQFVMGFGQAYHLTGPNLDQFEHATSA